MTDYRTRYLPIEPYDSRRHCQMNVAMPDYAVPPTLGLRAGNAQTNRAPMPADLSCAEEAALCSPTN